MNQKQYERLRAQGYTRIGLSSTQLCDTQTPLQLYHNIAQGPYSYLFESVKGDQQWGRYSIIGLPGDHIVRVCRQNIEVYLKGQCIEQHTTNAVFDWLKTFQAQFIVPAIDNIPARFTGGLVGYCAYDTVRYNEPRLAKTHKPDPLNLPDLLFIVSDELMIFDNFTSELHCIVYADATCDKGFETAQNRLQALVSRLHTQTRSPLPSIDLTQPLTLPVDECSSIDYPSYEEHIHTIKDYIAAGDAMQVVFSRKLQWPQTCSPMSLYRALRHLNPSPYSYYLDLDDFHIVGSSPEILVRKEKDTVTIRPIAGTRARGKTQAEDSALAKDLLQDQKECAEHLMLIDLARNDIGKVSKVGSVAVTKKMYIEYFSHVMHITSNVVGELQDHIDAFDLIKATLPAGTLSGAPKVRAMEIIDELESLKRGIYAGAVGYIGWHGNMDMAIAIRTAVIKDNTIITQAGGGIVIDSEPKTEWAETTAKSNAIRHAIALAQQFEKET